MIFLGSNSALGIWVDVCQRANIPVTGIMDSDYYGNTDSICGIPVIDTEENIENYYNKKLRLWTNSFFIATNWDPSGLNKEVTERDNQKRQRLIELAEKHQVRLQNIVDPLAVVPDSVELGGGNYIGAGAILEPNVKLGRYTQVWYQAIVGHEVEVGQDCVLNRRIGVWGTNIGNHVYMGIGSVYGGNYRDSHIGDGAWIHPGLAVAERPIKEGETVTIREQLRQRRTQTIGAYDTEAL